MIKTKLYFTGLMHSALMCPSAAKPVSIPFTSTMTLPSESGSTFSNLAMYSSNFAVLNAANILDTCLHLFNLTFRFTYQFIRRDTGVFASIETDG